MNALSTEFKQALYVTYPTFFAYFPLGIIFGVLFTQAGFPWYQAPVMSAVVYAGAVQFIALGMMINHNHLLAIIAASAFVALRNSFYGLSLHARFKAAPWPIRAFLVFGLVDASYAIFTARPPRKDEHDVRFCFYTTLLLYLYWVVGTFIGAAFADVIPPFQGMEFVLTAFFAVIAIEYYRTNRAKDALIIPVLAAVLAYAVLPDYYLLLAIILCAVYLHFKTRAAS